MLPLITMRTYAEEKRTGTIELLLTSPLTDLQIVLGKFLGAVALYSLMLAVTWVHIGILFIYGNPEWKPILTGYLGLLLMGASFMSIGLLISSLTRNQIVAGVVTFATLLMLWTLNWMSDSSGPTTQKVLSGVVHHRTVRRFFEGRHLGEPSRLLPELHHVRVIPDREVGRQRTLARVSLHA